MAFPSTNFVSYVTKIAASWLQAVNDFISVDLPSGTGASLVGWVRSATGAVTTTISKWLQRATVNVFDFMSDSQIAAIQAGGAGAAVSTEFQKALDSGAKRIYAPAGVYAVQGLTVPASVTLFGDGENATIIRSTSAATYAIQLGAASKLKYMTVNGNSLATRAVSIAGDYAEMHEVQAQYATYGFYNVANDVWKLINTSDSNCTYGFYNANRGINVTFENHESRGATTYGQYWTYSTQQPQGVRIKGGLFFGNQYALYFAKDAFNVEADPIIDGCTNTGIYFAACTNGASTDYRFRCPFVAAATFPVRILPGHFNLSFRDGTYANGVNAFVFEATTTNRSEDIVIDACNIGNCSDSSVYADSVYNLSIEKCGFTAAGGANDIATVGTYTTSANKPVQVRGNTFRKASPVSSFLTNCVDNIGFVTKGRGSDTMANGTTSKVVTHGLSVAPNNVTITANANLGAIWWDTPTATQFTVRCSTAAVGAVPFNYVASSD